jgi:hypothetical protein
MMRRLAPVHTFLPPSRFLYGRSTDARLILLKRWKNLSSNWQARVRCGRDHRSADEVGIGLAQLLVNLPTL